VVCKKLGVETTLNEIVKLAGFKENKGTTMYDLYKAARSKRLYAVGMKIGVKDLTKLRIPAIALLWNNHFVVVESTGTDTLIITDPPNKPQPISKENFQNMYSGFALLISKDKSLFPPIYSKGPDIRFDRYVHNFGKIPPDTKKKIECIFKFKNIGKEELIISKVRASCGCAAVLLSKNNVPTDGKGEVKVSFAATGRRGFQNHKVYIHSNDPITPLVQLQIQGIIKTDLIVFPKEVNFYDIKKRAPLTKKVYLIEPEGEKLKILKVTSFSHYVSAKASKSSHKYYKRHEIEISFTPDVPIGPLETQIVVYTNNTRNPKIQIPVRANIKGDIEFFPSMLFFGFLTQCKKEERVVHIFTTHTPFIIKKIEKTLDFLQVEVKPKEENRKYEIIGRLKKNVPEGNIEGEVIVYTNNFEQPELRIPVYGFIRK